MLSCLASLIKQHVLTTTASASVSSSVIENPLCTNIPSIISVSTRFLSQPREINKIFKALSSNERSHYSSCVILILPWFSSSIAIDSGFVCFVSTSVYSPPMICRARLAVAITIE